MTAIVRIEDLRIEDARGRVLLDGWDIDLEEGSVTAVVGPSGAGKSTLAHSVLGHLSPGLRRASGTIEVDGVDVFSREGARLRGRVSAFLPQDPASALDPARRIVAQLRMAARIAHPGSSRVVRESLVQDAARAADFDTALLRRRALQLSGGQAQRALLAWMFVVRPRVLVLDEPTSGLDTATALRVSTAFAHLPWQPAVLLISHDRELVTRVADRVLTIERGRFVADAAAPDTPKHPAPAPDAGGRAARTAPPAPPLLSVRDLTIRRGDRDVLRHVSLDLGAGELIAICGRSGEGKTSLARALCGFAPPESGVLLMGIAPIPWDARSRVRTGAPFLAAVGQDARAALHPGERVRITLQRALATARRRGRATVGDEEWLLRRVGLSGALRDRVPAELSGGQRHRLVLARALAAAPLALVCDETTAALDDATAGLVLDTLDDLRRSAGLAVLLITHQDAVAARADRVLTLEDGILR